MHAAAVVTNASDRSCTVSGVQRAIFAKCIHPIYLTLPLRGSLELV